MKSLLINNIDLKQYEIIGFDMDGTLYNERFLIKQVYQSIARYINENSEDFGTGEIYLWLLKRWEEKGSSYPFIFSEALEKFTSSNSEMLQTILAIYRNFKPNLTLNLRVLSLLDQLIANGKTLFLITDGNCMLQKAKFDSLQLGKWFAPNNVVFTGKLGKEYYKPNIKGIEYISCLQNRTVPVIYFGDRELDKKFALSADFDFIKVDDFNKFWEVD